MHLRGRARKSPEAEIARLREQLDEHFGTDGPARLRGLIYCVRRRKRTGYEAAVIAEQAKLTLDRVRQVLGGDYTRVSWDVVAAVLIALDAGNADLSVAGELYEEITASGPRPGRGARPAGLRPGALNWPDGLPAALAARWPIPCRTGPGAAVFRVDLRSPSRPGRRRDDADVPVASRRPREERAEVQTDEDVQAIDPMTVQSVREFIEALEIFNVTRGERSLRDIAAHCLDLNAELRAKTGLEIHAYSIASYSNLIRAGRDGKLSKKELVLSYLAGCGATPAELGHWAKAYIRLRTQLKRSDGHR